MKIIFMGTPDFACPALEKLISNKNFEVVAVYCRPPQIAGRGHKITNSPIHNLALKHNIKVITPRTLKDEKIQEEFKNFNADAAVIVAYGLILPKIILESTKFGCINIHPSLLPKWRGPSPIQYSLLNGDKKTGICIIKMDEGIDSGDILAKIEFDVAENDNYANLAPKMAVLGANLLEKTLLNLEKGKIEPVKQNHDLASFSKKIMKEDARIDWNLSAEEINRKIRAFSGSLTAYFEYRGEKIKVFEAEVVFEDREKKLGEIIDKSFLIQCGKGCIRPLVLQREGKKPMRIEEFLLGFKFYSISSNT